MINNRTPWLENTDQGDVRRIGEIIKKKREERRLSIEAIHSKTRVSVKYLSAMEDGNVNQFPAEVYYLSTLRQYAQFLGIPQADLMEIYRSKARQIQKEQPKKDETRKSRSLKIYLAVVVLAGIIVFAMLLKENDRVELRPKIEPQHPVAVSTAPVAITTAPPKMGGAVPPPAVSTRTVNAPVVSTQIPHVQNTGAKMTLSVKITDTSWIKISADNSVLFEGTLLAGSEKEWSAQERFYVVVGYAPGVRMQLNGKEVDVLKGARQDINQISLTRDDVKAKG